MVRALDLALCHPGVDGDATVDGDDEFGNVHGVVEGRSDGAVMLNSHDTVGYGDRDQWEYDPYAAEVEDGVMYGLGSSGMKCARAAMVYAGGALAALDLTPEHDVYVTDELMEEVCEGHEMRRPRVPRRRYHLRRPAPHTIGQNT